MVFLLPWLRQLPRLLRLQKPRMKNHFHWKPFCPMVCPTQKAAAVEVAVVVAMEAVASVVCKPNHHGWNKYQVKKWKLLPFNAIAVHKTLRMESVIVVVCVPISTFVSTVFKTRNTIVHNILAHIQDIIC